MNLEQVILQCMQYPEVEETTPFTPDILVYKVCGKMFAATNPNDFPPRVNLKCDPEWAEELRSEHEAVQPGYHMNKKHWNTITLDDSLSDELIAQLVNHSFRLVVQSLKKADRERLSNLLD